MTHTNAIELLKQLVAIPSISREEGAKADFLQKYMQETLSMHVQRVGNNLYSHAFDFDVAKPTILLNSHIDTVKAHANWTYNPFAATQVDQCIYGLGSNDAHASVVSLLAAFDTLRSMPQQSYNLILGISCEEEVSGKNGVEWLLTQLPAIDLAIVGEPTGLEMAIAEKGLMVVDCVAHGKAGHAARNEGDNALYKAVKDIVWCMDYAFPKVSEQLGPVKLTVTMIEAGSQHNVIPDTCKFTADVRLTECYTHQEILDIMQANMQAELTPRSMRLRASGIAKEHPVVQQHLSMKRGVFGSATMSDQALMPFPSVKVGPGDSARSHTANEYIMESEIQQAIAYYVELLNGLQIPKYNK
ncbi:MAG: M20 family metallo-hydrolase [Paludibacteraceae bacterium]|nr:M20 family metallo-hydrolase [Paludibacteraceae bacterium]